MVHNSTLSSVPPPPSRSMVMMVEHNTTTTSKLTNTPTNVRWKSRTIVGNDNNTEEESSSSSSSPSEPATTCPAVNINYIETQLCCCSETEKSSSSIDDDNEEETLKTDSFKKKKKKKKSSDVDETTTKTHRDNNNKEEENDEEKEKEGKDGHRPQQQKQNEKKFSIVLQRGRYCCYGCFFVLMIISFGIVMLWIYLFFTVQELPDPIASCGNCHCIVDEGDTCPTTIPTTTSSTTTSINTNIKLLRTQKPLNAYTLDCNPYDNNNDDNNPQNCIMIHPIPQDDALLSLGEQAVCAIHYESKDTIDQLGTMSNIELVLQGVLQNNNHGAYTTTTALFSSETSVNTNSTLINSTISPTASSNTIWSTTNSTTSRESESESSTSTSTCEGSSYWLVTYPSWEDAIEAGGFVTHAGHCGVCSTVQDLAAYWSSPDLTTEGKFCAKQGLINFNTAKQCYESLGMTSDCAYIWAANSANTADECFTECAILNTVPNDIVQQTTTKTTTSLTNRFFGGSSSKTTSNTEEESSSTTTSSSSASNNNGPPPQCTLNNCLQCDEDQSGPIFKQYAGRTRRRSGLLSAIARPCKSLVGIQQQACPKTRSLLLRESNF